MTTQNPPVRSGGEHVGGAAARGGETTWGSPCAADGFLFATSQSDGSPSPAAAQPRSFGGGRTACGSGATFEPRSLDPDSSIY